MVSKLHSYIGGGLLGLVLSSSEEQRVKAHRSVGVGYAGDYEGSVE